MSAGTLKPPLRRRFPGWALKFGVLLTYSYLYLPIVIIILFSFNASRINSWPITDYTLEWYRVLRNDDAVWEAVGLSVRVGLVSAGIALLLGTLGALALDRFQFRGKAAIRFMIILPLTLPGIVTGIAMLSSWALLDRPIATWTSTIGGWTFPWPLIIAHATFCVTLVLNTVVARLAQLPPSLNEAAADLGASSWTRFRRITFPLVLPAMISGAILAFTLSFDEVVVSLFLKGRESTLPLWIYGRLRQDFTPEINAVATVITVASLVGIASAALLFNRTSYDANKKRREDDEIAAIGTDPLRSGT